MAVHRTLPDLRSRSSYRLLPAGFQVMALATQAVFEFANVVAGEPFYEMTCYSMPGGSVKASNAVQLFGMPDIDGGLIGGASLKAADFLQIVAAAQ